MQVLSFSSEELALGYKDAIPALRTNENFTLEAANSIFAQVQDHLEINFLWLYPNSPRVVLQSWTLTEKPCTNTSMQPFRFPPRWPCFWSLWTVNWRSCKTFSHRKWLIMKNSGNRLQRRKGFSKVDQRLGGEYHPGQDQRSGQAWHAERSHQTCPCQCHLLQRGLEK